MKLLRKINPLIMCVILVMFFATVNQTSVEAKAKYEKGIYYNFKKNIYIQVGSQWDKGKQCTVAYEGERPGYLDECTFVYKKQKLVSKYQGEVCATIKIKSKKKLVWKGKKKYGNTWLNGTYKFVRKGNL